MTGRQRRLALAVGVAMLSLAGCAAATTYHVVLAGPQTTAPEQSGGGRDPSGAETPETTSTPSPRATESPTGGTCTAWAYSIAAHSKGGAATALAAALAGGGGGPNHNDWAILSQTKDGAVLVAGGSKIDVGRLEDGTWMAMEGQSCTEPVATAVIESARLACAPTDGLEVRAVIRRTPGLQLEAVVYDAKRTVLTSAPVTGDDMTISTPKGPAATIEIRSAGHPYQESNVDPLPQGVTCR